MKVIFFFILSSILELFSCIKPLKKNQVIFTSSENTRFNFNSKYLFLYFLEHDKNLDVYFVINDEALRRALISEYGEYFISSRTFRGLLLISSSKIWVTSDLMTPYLPILKNKKRNVLHIGHGIPLKKIILAVEGIAPHKWLNRFLRTRVFSHVTAYSELFKPVMEEAFQNKKIDYVSLGQPRNDAFLLYEKEEQLAKIHTIYPELPEHNKAILYAPTWRSYDTVKFFPFSGLSAEELNEYLKDNQTILFLRKHPYFPSILDESYLEQTHVYLFDSDFFPEVMDYLSYFDKLITDYSSIYLDFLCLDRPIAFIPYDLEEYVENTGLTMPYGQLTPGQFLGTKEDLYLFIEQSTDSFSQRRKEIAGLVNAKAEGNCEENYLFIQQLLKK